VGVRLFDGKFGSDRLRELPRQPGVYLFLDAKGRVLYAGKATTRLLESSRARRQAADVEEELRTLDNFVRKDVAPLRHALRTMGRSGCVPGDERDALFIAARQR
jgi:hypothetical protein